MLVKEINLGPTKIRFFDDECVSNEEEIEEILKSTSRLVQTAYAAQEIRRCEKAAK